MMLSESQVPLLYHLSLLVFFPLVNAAGHRMAVVALGVTFAFRASGKDGTASVLLVRKANPTPEPPHRSPLFSHWPESGYVTAAPFKKG